MYQDRITLTVKDIYEKEFKVDTMGYRQLEVDKYLDTVMNDYAEFVSIIEEKNEQINDLTEDVTKLKIEIRNLKTKLDILKETADLENGSSSVDMLKRISALEKYIYSKE